jgi:hypothetical protein
VELASSKEATGAMTATTAQKKELILYVLKTFLDVIEEKPTHMCHQGLSPPQEYILLDQMQ